MVAMIAGFVRGKSICQRGILSLNQALREHTGKAPNPNRAASPLYPGGWERDFLGVRPAAGLGPGARLAGPGGRTANSANEMSLRIVRMSDELAGATCTARQLNQATVEKPDQHPGPGKTEYGLIGRKPQAPRLGLFEIKPIAFNQCKIGRAHVETPVTNAQLVRRHLVEKKKKNET